MATLNIGGRKVTVDDSFLSLSPEQQEATVEEIGASFGAGQQSTAVDAIKSGGIGIAEGAIGLAGSGGDVGSWIKAGADKLGIPQDVQEGIKSTTRFLPIGSLLQGPDSQQIQKTVEGVTGEFYKPQTTLGKYARSIGEFLPAAAIPAGGMINRVANVVAPALASEGAGQLTEGTSYEPYARMAGALAGGIAGARGITPVPATAERTALANVLAAEGVPLTAGQRTGNMPLKWFEAAAADTPLAARKAASINEAQARKFTGAALKRMGMSGDEIATPQAIDSGVRNLSQKFEDLSNRNTMVADRQFVSDLVQVADKYVKTVIPSQRAMHNQNVQVILQDVVSEMQKYGGTMPGPLYQATRSRLSGMADSVRQSDPQLSGAIKGIRDALDSNMGRSISPADKKEWEIARKQWKNWKVIEKAITGAGSQTAEGFISPSQLRTAVAGQNRGQYARGQGDLADIARAGEALLRPLPQSGTAPRAAAGNLFASLGGAFAGNAMGGPVGFLAGAAAPAIAGRAMLSRPMQAYLGNQIAPMTRAQTAGVLALQQLLDRPEGARQ